MRLFKINLFVCVYFIVGLLSVNVLAQNNTDFETFVCSNAQKECYQLEVNLTGITRGHVISSWPIYGFPSKEIIEIITNIGILNGCQDFGNRERICFTLTRVNVGSNFFDEMGNNDIDTFICQAHNGVCYQLEMELVNYNENSHIIAGFPVEGFPSIEMIQSAMNIRDVHFYDPITQITISKHSAQQIDTHSLCQSSRSTYECFYLTETRLNF